jgi:hypothetical protein
MACNNTKIQQHFPLNRDAVYNAVSNIMYLFVSMESIFRKHAFSAKCGAVQLSYRDEHDIQDDRQWVRSKLNARGAKPFDFVQTVPPFDPSHRVCNQSIPGSFFHILTTWHKCILK